MKNLEIIDETNHFIVCIKPSGVLSQSDITGDIDMLTLVKKYLKEKYQKSGNVYLGLVHRLDRMTSGIMVFGKTSKGSSRLCEEVRNHLFVKKYLAICEGHFKEPQGTLSSNIYFDEALRKAFIKPTGKPGKLTYKVIEEDPLKEIKIPHTLVEVTLFSGRHHQIRVQMASISHPLVGDSLYGACFQTPIYLHAYYLSFFDPVTKEKLEYINFPTWKKERNNNERN